VLGRGPKQPNYGKGGAGPLILRNCGKFDGLVCHTCPPDPLDLEDNSPKYPMIDDKYLVNLKIENFILSCGFGTWCLI
jgi:hypothetical protein